jgi:hypothetical protein
MLNFEMTELHNNKEVLECLIMHGISDCPVSRKQLDELSPFPLVGGSRIPLVYVELPEDHVLVCTKPIPNKYPGTMLPFIEPLPKMFKTSLVFNSWKLSCYTLYAKEDDKTYCAIADFSPDILIGRINLTNQRFNVHPSGCYHTQYNYNVVYKVTGDVDHMNISISEPIAHMGYITEGNNITWKTLDFFQEVKGFDEIIDHHVGIQNMINPDLTVNILTDWINQTKNLKQWEKGYLRYLRDICPSQYVCNIYKHLTGCWSLIKEYIATLDNIHIIIEKNLTYPVILDWGLNNNIAFRWCFLQIPLTNHCWVNVKYILDVYPILFPENSVYRRFLPAHKHGIPLNLLIDNFFPLLQITDIYQHIPCELFYQIYCWRDENITMWIRDHLAERPDIYRRLTLHKPLVPSSLKNEHQLSVKC